MRFFLLDLKLIFILCAIIKNIVIFFNYLIVKLIIAFFIANKKLFQLFIDKNY
jgi:hypothetical protein